MKTLFFGAGPIGRLYAYLLHEATADKRKIKDFRKSPSANFFYPRDIRRNASSPHFSLSNNTSPS
ncbi:MAG: hypothetical protein KAT65_18865, partial [Methanophagales archaeon]|nr:hypothetical protein [Methanophagales archaeon]